MNRRFLTLEQLKSVISALLAKINQKPDSSSLSDVSFTGDYNDLSNRPDFSNFVNQIDFQNSYEAAMQQVGEHCMVIGRDYVTAGRASAATLGTKATAEGVETTASGNYSHAEGNNTTASGTVSHAEGNYTTASGVYSHVEGVGTTAQRYSQHVFGEYNILDTTGSSTNVKGSYVEIVGNGTADSARSNARTLDWSGNEVLAGKLTVGAGPTNAMDVATKTYVDTAVSSVDALPSQTGQSGKFLTTDGSDASWAAVEPEVFTVTLTLDLDYAPPRYIGDKTYSEIQAAITAGKIVQVQNGSWTYYYAGKDTIDNTLLLFVSSLYVTPDSNIKAPALDLFTLSSSNLWTSTGAIGQARITASGILKGDGSGRVTAAVAGTDYVASPGVFWATYGTTSFSEIKNAVDSGVLLIGIKYMTTIGFMRFYEPGSNSATFVSYGDVPTPPNPVILEMTVRNSTWSIITYTLAQSNMVGVVQPDKGGTGQTSLQATRNAMGLGDTTGALPVANGGTGAASFTANSVVMSGSSTTAALTTRAITNNTAASTALTASTNIPTVNTLVYGLNRYLNRSTLVSAADTGYTTYMARGEALNSADTNPTANGAISWTYA